jgi:hypothetical protein
MVIYPIVARAREDIDRRASMMTVRGMQTLS